MCLGQGGKASSKGTSMYMYAPPRGVDFGPLTLFQKSNAYHISHLVIECQFEGLGACPRKNFLEENCLKCRKMPLQKIGEMKGIQYEGQFLPLLPPMDEGRGGSCSYCPPAQASLESIICANRL